MEKIVIRVDNRLRISLPQVHPLGGELIDDLVSNFTYKNPEYYKKQAMGFWVGEIDPSICTAITHDNEISFPRGSTTKVRKVLREHDCRPRFEDHRTEGNPGLLGRIPPHNVVLRGYQAEAVEAAVKRENCLIRAPTGSGKTTAALALASRINLPTIVIVYNGGLFDQWVQRCISEFGMDKRDIGQIRGGKFSLKPITIAMQQRLNRISEERWQQIGGTFGAVICDEVQRFAASTFLNTIDRFAARYRIGISADETRKDRKEFLIRDAFGSVAYEIGREQLIATDAVMSVEIRIIPTEFSADWHQDSIDRGEVPDHNRLLDEITHDADRNDLIARWSIAELNRDHQCIAFSHRREHCGALSGVAVSYGITSGLLLGGQSAHDVKEFNRTIDRIKAGELKFAVGTYQAIGQGMDLPSVSRGFATTPIATNRQLFGQVRGRLCRKCDGKVDAVLYYFWDRHVFGIGHLKNINRWNENVNVWTPGSEGFISADRYIERFGNEKEAYTTSRSGVGLYFDR